MWAKVLVAMFRNELDKLVTTKRVWVFLGLLLLLLGVNAVIDNMSSKELQGKDWRQELMRENKDIEEVLTHVEGDPFSTNFKRIMEQNLKKNNYFLENNISPYDKNAWVFVNNSMGLTVVITIFLILIAADMVASEYQRGTIRMLLFRPHRRWKVIAAKLVAMMACLMAGMAVLFAVGFTIGGFLYGFEGAAKHYYVTASDGEIIRHTYWQGVAGKLILRALENTVICLLCLMISTLLNNSSLAIVISLLTLFAGTISSKIWGTAGWTEFLLFAHLNVSQSIDSGAGWETMLRSISILTAYCFGFIGITLVSFSRKEVYA
ncbi:ABC transporter permease [Paenibacillus chartarius]|uniref:ABC transporter permease n=1 Tax=Paenibacillus chartarius TaxID=747481 RepID=A0ABV6DKW4_9BACL